MISEVLIGGGTLIVGFCRMKFMFLTLSHSCHSATQETESKNSLKSSSAADKQPYSNPVREEYDLKSAKFSEMSEEKRAKLREIEVYLNVLNIILHMLENPHD